MHRLCAVAWHPLALDSFLTSLVGAGLVAASAKAQNFAPTGTGPEGFRLTELMGGRFAIETSRIALQRARSENVRDFAQLEINEQTAIAAALGALPGQAPPLRPDQQAIVARLSQMRTGRAFDAMYVQGQIAGHRELLTLNTGYAQNSFDQLGRSVAIVSVPTIQTHLAILSRLQSSMVG